MNLRRFFAAALGGALLALASGVSAADAGMPPFPALTGPVVDGANLLSADDQYAITQKLAAYDRGSGNQVVVVTVPTLNGYPIEQWGYQLGRHWGIGEKGKNTGAILIVDSGEKKLRIEVGYGLEGTLTDAISDNIIRNVIVPKFKQQDYAGGISDGVDAVLSVLGGDENAPQTPEEQHRDHFSTLFLMLFLGFMLVRVLAAGFYPGRRTGLWGLIGLWGLSGGWGGGYRGGGGFGGGGFGGGGFSGGGGSFGGGGASGSW